jgi:predicted Zn-dependent protease
MHSPETQRPTVHLAKLSDGHSAAAVEVEVRLLSEGLEISTIDGTARTWPYASLSTTQPLRHNATDALLTSSSAPLSTLFVPGAEFARDIQARAPGVSARFSSRLAARMWISAAGAIVAAVACLYIFDISPARLIASLIPDATRKKMGESVVSQLVGSRAVCRNPDGQAALETLMRRLSGDDNDRKFDVVVVDWEIANAFAAPGEQIVIARGVLDGAKSPDEVAGVLAHEMGHGLERHPETSFVRAIGLSAGAELILGGSTGGLAGMGVLLAQLSYSRAAEQEADMRGLSLLREAGISPLGFLSFLDRVSLEAGEERSASFGALDMLRSHPLTSERLKLVKEASTYPTSPSLTEGEWSTLKTICSLR